MKNVFEANNKDTRKTPMTPCSSVSIVNFTQVNVDWDSRDKMIQFSITELDSNQSYGWSNMMKLCSFVIKNPYRKDCLFLFRKGCSLLIRGLFINVTLNPLLLLVKMEKSSKWGEWLQNKRCSLMLEHRNSRVHAFWSWYT